MAVQYADYVAGTAKTWKNTAGDFALTLTSLANGSARQGDKGNFIDATFGNPAYLRVYFQTAVASAATNGLQVELYAGESTNATAATDNPAGLTGADGAFASPDELKLQLFLVGGLNLSNATGTAVQDQVFIYFPSSPYWVPVVVNKSGQALTGTAANHFITSTPYYRRAGY